MNRYGKKMKLADGHTSRNDFPITQSRCTLCKEQTGHRKYEYTITSLWR